MNQLVVQQNEVSINLSVLQDVMHEDLYHVKVAFTDKQSMLIFIKSEYYAMISGSFKVLGMVKDKFMTKHSNINGAL